MLLYGIQEDRDFHSPALALKVKKLTILGLFVYNVPFFLSTTEHLYLKKLLVPE